MNRYNVSRVSNITRCVLQSVPVIVGGDCVSTIIDEVEFRGVISKENIKVLITKPDSGFIHENLLIDLFKKYLNAGLSSIQYANDYGYILTVNSEDQSLILYIQLHTGKELALIELLKRLLATQQISNTERR